FPEEGGQGVVEKQELVWRRLRNQILAIEVQAPPAGSAAFDASLASGVVNQDATHGLSGGSKEVAAAVPVLRFLTFYQAGIGFVNKSRGLERLPRLLLRQLLRRQLAKFIVDERQELLGGTGVALLDGEQDSGDFGHPVKCTALEPLSLSVAEMR